MLGTKKKNHPRPPRKQAAATTTEAKSTATTKAKPEATAARFDEPEPIATKAAARWTRSRAKLLPGGIVADAVEQSDHQEDSAPPDIRVQIVEHYLDGGWMGKLVEPGAKNQHAVEQQRDAYEEPDGNRSARSHLPHQKIILSAINTMVTVAAQNAGFWYSATCASDGISVAP